MRFARVACLTVGVLAVTWPTMPAAVAVGPASVGQVEQVTLTSDDHGPVVLIRTSRPLHYRSQLLASPLRLVLDFEDARFAWRAAPLRPDAGPVVAVRGSQFRAGIARIVVALGRDVPHRITSTQDGVRIAFFHVPAVPSAALRASGEPAAPSAAPLASAGPAASAPGSRRDPVGRPILYGIVLRGEDSVAYLEDPRTGRVTGFKRGDRVGAGVLDTIEERHVSIRMPSGAIQLRVDDPKPGGGPPAPRIQVGPGATPP